MKSIEELKDDLTHIEHIIKEGEKFEDEYEMAAGLNMVNRAIRSRIIREIGEIENGNTGIIV